MGYPYPNFCLCAFLGPYFKEALWECEGFDAGSLVSIAVLCSGILPMSICTSKVTAFGPCDPEFAAFGDRFIQLGNWRMGIFDDRHFTIAHRDGRTPEILTSDGVVHANFPSSIFNTWNRPLGYPSGIVFGHQFIQMGNWRVAAIDDTYLSISHKDGQTSKIYSSTGDITHGPTTAHNAWSRPIGAASGVTFGDRFIQIGKFRIGDADGLHLATTYISGVPGGTSLFLHAHWGWCGTINKHVHLGLVGHVLRAKVSIDMRLYGYTYVPPCKPEGLTQCSPWIGLIMSYYSALRLQA